MTNDKRARDFQAGVNVDYDSADAASKATEEVMNQMQDIKDGMGANAEKVTEDTATTPEEFINKKGFNAWRAASEVKNKQEEEKTKKEGKKFQVDLDKYLKFTDSTCSDFSKDFDTYIKRLQELNEQGCNIERLDTAASGLSAESGEFMEIVKKMKFQGKPWNEDNKEHLTKELGDIMWYAAQAAHALDIRLDEVLYINTLKLAKRYSGGEFSIEDSENRAPGDI